MAQPYDDNGEWVACPAGTLRMAAASLRDPTTATRRRFLSGVATGLVVAAIGLGAASAYQVFFSTAGHISCRECQTLLQRFARNDLAPELATRVRRHLNDCPPCQAAYDSLRATVSLRFPSGSPCQVCLSRRAITASGIRFKRQVIPRA